MTKKDVKSYISRYKGSDEEINDLVEFYEEYEGDMTHLLKTIIGSTDKEIPRYKEIYEGLFKIGELEDCPLFRQTIAKVEALPDEKAEAKAAKKEIKKRKKKEKENAGGDIKDLEKMILAKREDREKGFLSYMKNKYCGKEDEEALPDEEDEPKPKKKPAKK